MGSGTSRGKKVAPARVTDLNVTKTQPGDAPSKQDGGPFERSKIQPASRAARSRAQPDSLSEGHDSEEEEDGAAQADRGDGEMAFVRKTPPKRTFLRSKTYGLCHFSQEDNEDATGSAQRPGEPPGASQSQDVNKRNNMKQHTHGYHQDPSSQNVLQSASTKQQSSNSHHASLTTPVILYDGSEEELMDTIEREFS